ncbi:MAG: holo-ACP synthase [Elusimicrobia bacterium]|nr:holo-ACP synthase [Elusimicrobiota bacterium]
MKFLGNGVDIVHVKRFDSENTEKIARRLLSEGELEYCRGKSDFVLHMAGRIAAKEAIYKAISLYTDEYYWKDIAIIPSKRAPVLDPECRLAGFLKKNKFSLSLSISHDGDYAVAHAVVWSKN